MSLPLYGDSDLLDFMLIREKKRVHQLTKIASSLSSYPSWVHYFDACDNSRIGLALEAMLAYWLSWFIFSSETEDKINGTSFH